LVAFTESISGVAREFFFRGAQAAGLRELLPAHPNTNQSTAFSTTRASVAASHRDEQAGRLCSPEF